jgi:ribonuclease D
MLDTPEAFAQMLTHLNTQPLVALDTEADSLFHYYPKVCLIQLSARAHAGNAIVDYLIDPLRLDDLSSLGDYLARPDVEVVMHAAENDIMLLQRDFGFIIRKIFDTQMAARILGWQRVGLAAILEEQFGIISNKRMQRTDWSRRPLSPEQMNYATNDTHSLLRLRDMLIDALKARGRWDEALDAFAQIVLNRSNAEPAEARTFWDMKGTRDVPRDRHNVLQALWQWREAEAKRRDLPPFKIVNDATLVALANDVPASRAHLRNIDGMSSYVEGRYGNTILSTIGHGLHQPVPALPQRRRVDDGLDKAGQMKLDALRDWRTRTAEARGVALDIVFNTATLIAVVQRNPQTVDDLTDIVGITPWKLREYGATMLRVLAPTRSS